MSSARTLEYAVTFYFRFVALRRIVRARCVADAINKARGTLPSDMEISAIIAVPKE